MREAFLQLMRGEKPEAEGWTADISYTNLPLLLSFGRARYP